MHNNGTFNDVLFGDDVIIDNNDDDESLLDLFMIKEKSLSFNTQKDGQNVTPNSTNRWTSLMQINFSTFCSMRCSINSNHTGRAIVSGEVNNSIAVLEFTSILLWMDRDNFCWSSLRFNSSS